MNITGKETEGKKERKRPRPTQLQQYMHPLAYAYPTPLKPQIWDFQFLNMCNHVLSVPTTNSSSFFFLIKKKIQRYHLTPISPCISSYAFLARYYLKVAISYLVITSFSSRIYFIILVCKSNILDVYLNHTFPYYMLKTEMNTDLDISLISLSNYNAIQFIDP